MAMLRHQTVELLTRIAKFLHCCRKLRQLKNRGLRPANGVNVLFQGGRQSLHFTRSAGNPCDGDCLWRSGSLFRQVLDVSTAMSLGGRVQTATAATFFAIARAVGATPQPEF